MNVNCPNCQWSGRADAKPKDRLVMCPRCRNKMLVRGTGMIVSTPMPPPHPQGPIPVIYIPKATPEPTITREPPPFHAANHSNPLPVKETGLIYTSESIRMFDDGRVWVRDWKNREDAKHIQGDVKLAIEELKLSQKILTEEQRHLNSKYTARNRTIGPSLYRHSHKGVGGFLYLAQLVGKAVVSTVDANERSALDSRRQLTATLRSNLEHIALEIKRYLHNTKQL